MVVDSETGDPLIGTNVVIQGTTTGGQTDLDGRFEIAGLAPGTYDVQFSYIGFQSKTVRGVEVEAGETARLEVSLAPGAVGLEEVVVEAEAARDSEAGLLARRQKAAAISNAISAEAISQSGSATAAGALEKVTGTTVVDGKYVYVRGLGGRYMNTQLNGAELPSATPDGNAVPLDLFPASLLDNVVITKTFTPDQPGSFTGGNVNVSTKSFPEDLSLTLSSSVSYNSEVGLGENMLWLSEGAAGVPSILQEGAAIPGIGQARTDRAMAERLNAVSRALTSGFAPVTQNAPLGRSHSLSFGNQLELFGRPLGLVASLSYDQNVTGYSDGVTGRYNLTGDVSTVEGLDTELLVSDRFGAQEDLVGGLATLSFKPHARHELGLTYLYNRSDETSARFQVGALPRDLSASQVYRTRTLHHTERTMNSVQGRGEHVLGESGMRVEWNATLARSTQDEPDLRFFTDHFSPGADTTYYIRPSSYPVPTRYFRDLGETTWSSDLSLSVPFASPTTGGSATLKVGGSYLEKDRTMRERIFQYRQDQAAYGGSPTQLTSDALGLVGQDEHGRYRFGYYLVDVTEGGNNYDGEQLLAAGFVMVDLPLLQRLRLVGGVRYEYTDLSVATLDEAEAGQLTEQDLLPSANLIYALKDDMNLRLAYGRTLARPSLREFAPFSSFQFVGDYTLVGNSDLKRTLTHNVDLRWEWFTGPGELLAVSGFYKELTNPIERVVVPSAQNPEFTYKNVDQATVYGVEVEVSKRLDQISSALQHFQVGANLTLVDSDVSIAPSELQQIRAYDPDASDTRALQGQSPYVVNVNVGFEHPDWGTSINTYYNLFGRRLDTVVGKGAPNYFEAARTTVDVVASQRLLGGAKLKLSAKNIFNAEYRMVQTFKGQDFINERYDRGRSVSVGLSYTL